MIQIIGLMVGFYIIVRMIQLILSNEKTFTRIAAAVNLLFVMILILGLLASGASNIN
jgi:hypothetical protein